MCIALLGLAGLGGAAGGGGAGMMGMLGTAVSAMGAMASASAQANAANAQAQIARNNAIIAQQNAAFAAAQGDTKAADEGLKGRAQQGAIKAAFAANNVDVNSGSAALTQESQAMISTKNVLTIRSDAARQAWGYEAQATQYNNQASLYSSEASSAQAAGGISAFSSLVGGIGKMSNVSGDAFPGFVGA